MECCPALRGIKLPNHKKSERQLKCRSLRERTNVEGYLLPDPNCMTFWKEQTVETRPVVARDGGSGDDEQAEHRIWGAVKLVCVIV